MAIELADIFINFRADSAELTKEFNSSRKRAKSWSKDIGKVSRQASDLFNKVAISAAAASTAIGAIVSANAANIDSLGKTAAKLGVATEALQDLRLAGDLAGLATTQIDTGLQRMVRRLSEAAQGTGEAKNAIQELGLSARDLANSAPDQAFKTISTALSQIPNQADRVRLAFKFFDTEGVGLLNLNPEVLERASAALGRMGGHLSALDVQNVERMNDSFTIARRSLSSLSEQITAKLAPGLTKVADTFFDVVTAGDGLDNLADSITKGILFSLENLVRFSAGVSSFVNGNQDIAKYGVIGFLLLGKKGALLGAAIGGIFDKTKDLFNLATGGEIGRLKAEIKFLRRSIKIDEDRLKNNPSNEEIAKRVEEDIIRLARYESQYESLNVTATSAFDGALNDLKGGAASAQDFSSKLRTLADGLKEIREQPQNVPEAIKSPETANSQIPVRIVPTVEPADSRLFLNEFDEVMSTTNDIVRRYRDRVEPVKLSLDARGANQDLTNFGLRLDALRFDQPITTPDFGPANDELNQFADKLEGLRFDNAIPVPDFGGANDQLRDFGDQLRSLRFDESTTNPDFELAGRSIDKLEQSLSALRYNRELTDPDFSVATKALDEISRSLSELRFDQESPNPDFTQINRDLDVITAKFDAIEFNKASLDPDFFSANRELDQFGAKLNDIRSGEAIPSPDFSSATNSLRLFGQAMEALSFSENATDPDFTKANNSIKALADGLRAFRFDETITNPDFSEANVSLDQIVSRLDKIRFSKATPNPDFSAANDELIKFSRKLDDLRFQDVIPAPDFDAANASLSEFSSALRELRFDEDATNPNFDQANRELDRLSEKLLSVNFSDSVKNPDLRSAFSQVEDLSNELDALKLNINAPNLDFRQVNQSIDQIALKFDDLSVRETTLEPDFSEANAQVDQFAQRLASLRFDEGAIDPDFTAANRELDQLSKQIEKVRFSESLSKPDFGIAGAELDKLVDSVDGLRFDVDTPSLDFSQANQQLDDITERFESLRNSKISVEADFSAANQSLDLLSNFSGGELNVSTNLGAATEEINRFTSAINGIDLDIGGFAPDFTQANTDVDQLVESLSALSVDDIKINVDLEAANEAVNTFGLKVSELRFDESAPKLNFGFEDQSTDDFILKVDYLGNAINNIDFEAANQGLSGFVSGLATIERNDKTAKTFVQLKDGVESLGSVFGSLGDTFTGQSKKLAKSFGSLHAIIATAAAYSAATQALAAIDQPTVFQKLAAYGNVLAVGLSAVAKIKSVTNSSAATPSSSVSGQAANQTQATSETPSETQQQNSGSPPIIVNLISADELVNQDVLKDRVLTAIATASENLELEINVDESKIDVKVA